LDLKTNNLKLSMKNKTDELPEIDCEDLYEANGQYSNAKKKSPKTKCLNFFKKFITFLVSRVGLMIVMVLELFILFIFKI